MIYKDLNALVSGARKAGELEIESWPEHLRPAAGSVKTWPNITEQRRELPGAFEARREENKLGALILEGALSQRCLR